MYFVNSCNYCEIVHKQSKVFTLCPNTQINTFLLYRDSEAQVFPLQKFLEFALNTEYLGQGYAQLIN